MPRLLHLVGQGQGTDPPKRRKGRPSPALSLTPDEARHLRASVRNIARTKYGTLVKLAAARGVHPAVLTNKSPPHPGLAVALWRITGTPVEVLLTGKLVAVPSPGGAS
jgi:hypothetical protein